ncbi:hypothetical protein [Paraburkholderia sp. EG304]|uniref:hypothetical protein n=1 Tax=Paraburkholderia sp. EG304 TaxID=3237015 RepID=UPI0039792FA5
MGYKKQREIFAEICSFQERLHEFVTFPTASAEGRLRSKRSFVEQCFTATWESLMSSSTCIETPAVPAGYSQRQVQGKLIDLSQWPTFDEATLEGENREDYLARKNAVVLFLSGASYEAIRSQSPFSPKHIYRLISERCLAPHPDGREFGWRGLVPYERIQSYHRKTKVCVDDQGRGGAGALQYVLNAHPALRAAFEKRIQTIAPRNSLSQTGRSLQRHCVWFLDELRKLGYEARGEWPFNTESLAYYSVRRYVAEILQASPKALANAEGGQDLVKKLRTGDGTNRPVTRFMQRVEMDAHKIDGRFCVSIPLLAGGFREKIIHRLWVIVILEVVSRAVLGYY